MKRNQLSLASVPGKLSRAEMKNIMAGDESLLSCEDACVTDDDCNSGKKCKESSCPDDPKQKMNRCLAV
jgi:hypothetical protein